MYEYDNNWETTNWQYVQSQVSKLQYRIYRHKKMLKKHYLQRVLLESSSTKLLVSELTIRQYKQDFSDEEKSEIINRIHIKEPENLFNIEDKSRMNTITIAIKERLIFYVVVPNWYNKFELKTTIPIYKSPHNTTIEEIKHTLLETRTRYAIQVTLKLTTIINEYTQTSMFRELLISPVIGRFVRPYLQYMQKKFNSKSQRITHKNRGNVLPYYEPLKHLLLNAITHNLKKTFLNLSKELDINQEMKIVIAQRTNKIFLFHTDIDVLRKMRTLVLKLLKISHSDTVSLDNIKIVNLVHGISLYRFKISLQVIDKHLIVSIRPDEKSQRHYLKIFSQIVHQNRNVSTYILITLLRPMLLQWATYFQYYDCKETFILLNYKSNQILRAWVFRRDKKKGRNVVKEDHFPSGNIYKFPDINRKNNWVLCGIMNKNANKKLFLPQLQWLSLLR